jgi:exoribonuclease R
MTVSEYLDQFTHLSRYAPDEVNTDAKRQECFIDGLIGPLNYQLQSHTFLNFQMLLNKAIGLENKCKELREQKRKFQSQGQSSSNTRPRYNSSQDSLFYSSTQGRNHGQSQQYRSFEEPEESNPMTPQAPNPHQNRKNKTKSNIYVIKKKANGKVVAHKVGNMKEERG